MPHAKPQPNASWRAGKTTAERGYGSKWQRARLLFLQQHPLCEMCDKAGKVTASTVVDHRTPHKGDLTLFWSRSNWQAICAVHHNSDKQAFERTGHVVQTIGLDGYPVDANEA